MILVTAQNAELTAEICVPQTPLPPWSKPWASPWKSWADQVDLTPVLQRNRAGGSQLMQSVAQETQSASAENLEQSQNRRPISGLVCGFP